VIVAVIWLQMNDIPTELDWRSEPWTAYTKDAYRRFFGLTDSDASTLFHEDSLARQKELCAMPLPCFEYYTRSYMIYLASDQSRGDSAASAGFLMTVDDRLTDILNFGTGYVGEIIDTIEYLRENQSWFQTNNILFSQGAERCERLREFLRSILANRAG
jgi:hypothetical protein